MTGKKEAENKTEIESTEKELEKGAQEETTKSNSTTIFLIIIGIILVCFIAFGIGYYITKDKITGKVTTIDDLHLKNLQGKSIGNNYMYNGYSFVYANGFWYTQVMATDGQGNKTLLDIPLHYGPRQMENITVVGEINEKFQKPEIYITFDPDAEDLSYIALSAGELSLNLARGLNILPKSACTKNITDACAKRRIINCNDNTEDAIIYLKEKKGAPLISMDGNCVTVQGYGADIIKAADRLILMFYNIMPRS